MINVFTAKNRVLDKKKNMEIEKTLKCLKKTLRFMLKC